MISQEEIYQTLVSTSYDARGTADQAYEMASHCAKALSILCMKLEKEGVFKEADLMDMLNEI